MNQLNDIDQWYLNKEEPLKGCLLALRSIIQKYQPSLEEAWKYRMPFFCYKGKMFCYLWQDKKTLEPYIGIVNGGKIDHPALESGDRARMKILRIKVDEDIPVELIYAIFDEAVKFY